MTEFAAELGQLVGARDDPLRLVVGQVVVTAGVASVNVAGGGGVVKWAGEFVPVHGDPVLVLLQGGQAYVLAPVASAGRPATGTVSTVPGGSTVTVNVAGVSTACTFLASYSPVVGDTVALDWSSSQPRVLGKIGTVGAPAAPAPPSAPPPAASAGVTTFPAVDSGSFRDGSWRGDTSDVIQGDAPGYAGHGNNGAWFYGSAPESLAGATVTKAEVYLPSGSSSVSTPAVHLYRHGSRTRPAGDVTRLAGPFDVAKPWGTAGWYPFDTAAAQVIVNLGGGVGIAGTPYARLDGLSKNGQSGALRITWSR